MFPLRERCIVGFFSSSGIWLALFSFPFQLWASLFSLPVLFFPSPGDAYEDFRASSIGRLSRTTAPKRVADCALVFISSHLPSLAFNDD